MSGSVAKAERRAIRKAFGPRAVDEVVSIAGDVKGDVGRLSQALIEERAERRKVTGLLDAEIADRRAFVHRTLWERLRWVVTGR